jgi:hypothetical protein
MKRVGERAAQISGLKVPMTNDSLISVVDDVEALRRSLEGLLKSLGHGVAVFSSAELRRELIAEGQTPPIAHGDDDVALQR